MKVNNNVITMSTSKKNDALKQPNKSEDFKKVLNNHELRSKNSSNENVHKKNTKDQNSNKTNDDKDNVDVENKGIDNKDAGNKDVEKIALQGSTAKELNNSEENNKLEENNKESAKIISFIEASIDVLKQTIEKPSKELSSGDMVNEEMAQIQQLLQFLSNMFQSMEGTSTTIKDEIEPNSINLESLMVGEQLMVGEKLTPDGKGLLKNNLSEIVALLEKAKGTNIIPSQVIEVLQKLTTEVEGLKGDLSLLKIPSFQTLSGISEDKSIKDNLLKKVVELTTKTIYETLPKNQMQSGGNSEGGSKSSGNSSFEEKFLNNLIGEDKDAIKISKAVNFMNQFETVKTVDAAKVQTVNLVIDKSNFGTDVIKTIKFMDINNIKDLTVKMNPKELGEITVKLTMESGIMKASISALNKDTYNLLNQNIQDISDKLKNMDIKIQSLDINIYEDSTFFNKESNDKNNNGRRNNKAGTNGVLEEDISISNNYVIEENQVNKFV